MTYQSHDGDKATSDSARKLERIKLPEDMTGRRVLDIGCNEGFFCGECARRGAEVIGLDTNEDFLRFARERYESLNIRFIRQSWGSLPEGPFDVVLWLSAMHYETDPAAVLTRIRNVLSPTGLLILECGIHPVDGLQMMPVPRRNDMPLYPTMPLLMSMLKGFVVREVAQGERTPGDPIPRHVLHCRPIKTTVLLVRGGSGVGKSHLGRVLEPSATKIIRIDRTLPPLRRGEVHVTPLQIYTRDHCDPQGRDLERFYRGVDEVGLTNEYAEFLARGIAKSDNLVVVEGYMTDAQARALEKQLSGRAVVWDANRFLVS